MSELFGEKRLLTQASVKEVDSTAENEDDGTVIAQDALAEKVVCLFFSATWCAPCQHFVPVLKDIYTELRQRGEPVEVVFLSFDKTKEEMMDYYKNKHGDWLAVPFEDPVKEVLAERYSISVIPKLVIIQPSGEVITSKGRKDIQDKGIVCMRTWRAGMVSKVEKHDGEETDQQDGEKFGDAGDIL